MDERADRGQYYPGGATSSVPAGGSTDKVDRVALGEIGESYTLKTVKDKVDQIVRVIAPAAVCLALCASAATGVLEDLPNTARVVTNEEDAVAMAAVGALGQAVSNRVDAVGNSLQAEIAGATNAVVQAAILAAEAESNRVDATYAKRSEIPAAPDLAPYALKSELPTDYLTENDITNFATRTWISAQGYATGAEMGARLDAQDNAIAAATNAQNAAIAATTNAQNAAISTASNALATAHAADVAALRSGTNAIDRAWRAGTNELAAADARLDAKIDALELTGGMTRLWTSDATRYQDATGVVWQVQTNWIYTIDGVGYTTEQMREHFEGGYLSWEANHEYDGPYGTNEIFTGWFVNDGSGTSPLGYWNGDWSGATNMNLSAAQYTYYEYGQITARRWSTNAIDRVAYTNDVAAAARATFADAVEWATNYTDTVAEAFESGARSVDHANSAGYANESGISASLTLGADYIEARGIIETATNYTDEATNALAQAIGGGGGMPEWREEFIHASMEPVFFVTNGCMEVHVDDDMYVSTAGWPSGAAMFVRCHVTSDYAVMPPIRLVGYGTWPTNDFQSVWWRSGTNIYVKVLMPEPDLPFGFYDTAGGESSVSGATLTYQAASNSVGAVALLAGTNVLHIAAPAAIAGRVRDFGLTVTTEDAATITLDSSVSWRFDAASTNLAAGTWNRVYCTESPTGVFSLQLWTPDSSQEATP